ncbi:CRISPR-associated endonuclease Cas2 [Desulfobacter sp. UBA2225]|uniref:CRISPR-associated endonuclease Cas2 n=1 Tax=Desulfobacter sp. UBA2225 TaxID=1961413 RepID=UPI00257EBBB0|nr:CRISPR-associated endonuclease Cas2 [Desulfobacter sp. UBA2225]
MKKIFYVVAYDVKSDKKRKKISELLEEWGVRVNFSVFECEIPRKALSPLKKKIEALINPKSDSVLYYPLCLNCRSQSERCGMTAFRSFEQKLIVV